MHSSLISDECAMKWKKVFFFFWKLTEMWKWKLSLTFFFLFCENSIEIVTEMKIITFVYRVSVGECFNDKNVRNFTSIHIRKRFSLESNNYLQIFNVLHCFNKYNLQGKLPIVCENWYGIHFEKELFVIEYSAPIKIMNLNLKF